jgi:RNA-binding protein
MTQAQPNPPLPRLTGKQRRYLRGLAHHLEPVVQIGKEGVTEALRLAVDRTLEDHELIKVRVLEAAPADRDEVAEPLAQAVGAHVIGTLGRIVMLYRARSQQPEIVLPAASAPSSPSP